MSEQEEVLEGGNVNHVVRVRNTVHRPIGYWSPSVHELLRHLENQNFDGAPRFLGIDNAGREILTYLDGEVPGDDYPELKPYMWLDDTLVNFARILRRYHDATHGFVAISQGRWQLSYGDDEQHEVICHNDADLYNVVFQNGSPVALIDFDMAGPGPRMWDIAYALYTSVPLASFEPDPSRATTVSYQPGMHSANRRRRIHLFFKAYGISAPHDLKRWIIERLTALCDVLMTGAAEGNLAFRRMVDEGHLAYYENEIQFLMDHFEEWTCEPTQ